MYNFEAFRGRLTSTMDHAEPNAENLLIIGASVRAAAHSALRAGFTPWAIDQFGDVDLCRHCRTSVLTPYPAGLMEAAQQFPTCPWLYTGGLENHPRLIERLAAERPLLGNRGTALRHVRDPARLSDVLVRAGFAMPEMRKDLQSIPRDGTWLLKRKRSAGGLHLRPLDADIDIAQLPRGWYGQRCVEGLLLGAVFVGANGAARLLGVTRQIKAVGAVRTPFIYGGSLGPVELDESQQGRWQALGNLLAAEFGLVGLFGVDAIDDGNRLWILEVNPRYTASIEVLERALGVQTIRWHADACRDGRVPTGAIDSQPDCFSGKAILYASHDIAVSDQMSLAMERANNDPFHPSVADIPQPGVQISAGQPIATILAESTTISDVEERLQLQRQRWEREIG